MLEHEERAARNVKEADRASEMHARAVSDVELEASLLLESAAAEHRAGHGEAALAKLETAAELGAHAQRCGNASERIARKHARPDRQRAALDALAAIAARGENAGGAERARAAALSRSAARLAGRPPGRRDKARSGATRYALTQAPHDALVALGTRCS